MFLPLGDDNRNRSTFPFVVILIIAANCVVWYLQLSLGGKFTSGYSAVPYEIVTGHDLMRAQAVNMGGHRILIPNAPGPHPIQLTILSAMFMHASWLHIIGNMLYLWIFGDQVEDLFGHFKFIFFYLLCGVGASLAQIVLSPMSLIPCVGASGAIAGVLGSYLIRYSHNSVSVLTAYGIQQIPATVVLGFWIVLQIFGQMGSGAQSGGGVAYAAHIGGFVTGVLLTIIFARAE